MAFKMRGTPYPTKSPLEHSGPWNDAAYLKKHKEAWGEDHSDHGNLLAKDGGKKEGGIEKAGQTLIKKAGKSPMRQGPGTTNIQCPWPGCDAIIDEAKLQFHLDDHIDAADVEEEDINIEEETQGGGGGGGGTTTTTDVRGPQ